jgi:hypothetical protein
VFSLWLHGVFLSAMGALIHSCNQDCSSYGVRKANSDSPLKLTYARRVLVADCSVSGNDRSADHQPAARQRSHKLRESCGRRAPDLTACDRQPNPDTRAKDPHSIRRYPYRTKHQGHTKIQSAPRESSRMSPFRPMRPHCGRTPQTSPSSTARLKDTVVRALLR